MPDEAWWDALEVEPSTGLLVRPGTYDEYIIKEARSQLRTVPWHRIPGQRVLDLGANIGSFCWRAAKEGALGITAIEPEPENTTLLQANGVRICEQFPPCTILTMEHAVSNDGSDVVLYVNDEGKNKGNHSVVTKGRKRPLIVGSLSLDDLLSFCQPFMVKVDIEYAEYGLARLWSLPDHVRVLFIELHLQGGDHRARAESLAGSLLLQGFTALHVPVIGPKNWHTYGVYER